MYSSASRFEDLVLSSHTCVFLSSIRDDVPASVLPWPPINNIFYFLFFKYDLST